MVEHREAFGTICYQTLSIRCGTVVSQHIVNCQLFIELFLEFFVIKPREEDQDVVENLRIIKYIVLFDRYPTQ